MVRGTAKKRQTIRIVLSVIVGQTLESGRCLSVLGSLKSALGLAEQEQAKDAIEDFG